MKHVKPARTWAKALVATLCAFTLAFSMMGVAWADNRLEVGSGDLDAQADSWSFDVYVQAGENGPEVKVKSYDETTFAALAQAGATTANPISGLYYKNDGWLITTAAPM